MYTEPLRISASVTSMAMDYGCPNASEILFAYIGKFVDYQGKTIC